MQLHVFTRLLNRMFRKYIIIYFITFAIKNSKFSVHMIPLFFGIFGFKMHIFYYNTIF